MIRERIPREMKLMVCMPLFCIFSFLVPNVQSGAVQLNKENFDSTLSSSELVFVNYYANWCRFSQMLEPIYDEFADKLKLEFPTEKVIIGKVDCDVQTEIASKNQINKYPTLKLYRYGISVKKEYRGARSAEAFVNYIKEQLNSPLKLAQSFDELSKNLIESTKRTIVGYFADINNENYKVYLKLSSILRDSCSFVAGAGDFTAAKRPNGDHIVFRENGNTDMNESTYSGSLNNYEALYAWANERCTPIVREITFENAEELTEEGLPFLILFHKPDDLKSVAKFEEQVKIQLVHLKSTINAVHADGLKFSHPLHHLGKSVADLPLVAIDSFRHMYLFPNFDQLEHNQNLLNFVNDLHSGKLHREFHNGPDPTTTAPKEEGIELNVQLPNHLPKQIDSDNQQRDQGVKSTPPESVFIKLAPSRERYSIRIDGDL